MTTSSGTYNFEAGLGDLVIAAYRRCGVHAPQLTAQHMADARMEANLLMSDWVADGLNLWQVAQGSTALVDGTASYTMPSTMIFMLDVYIRTSSTDRLVYPISRSDYAAIPNKSNEGTVTSFWLDRQITPVIYLWPVPDNSTDTLIYYYMRQAQDSLLTSGYEPEIPWYYLSAFVAMLAVRLATIYAPDRVAMLDQQAAKAWQRALQVGTENVPLEIQAQFGSYYR